MTPKSHLEVGYVGRAHGLKGEVAVRTFDPASTTLEHVDRVLVRSRGGAERVLEVVHVRGGAKELLVQFRGIHTREAGEALIGSTLLVFREDLEAPGEGEFFQGDLVGLAAVDEAGAPLGTVEEIWATGEVPNLVIRAAGSEELVVPFAEDFVVAVELEARRLVVRPPIFTDEEG